MWHINRASNPLADMVLEPLAMHGLPSMPPVHETGFLVLTIVMVL